MTPANRPPARIQRQRAKGQTGIPPGAKYVGRGKGCMWGNPFTVTDAIEAGFAETGPEARAYVAETFRAWLTYEMPAGPPGTPSAAANRDWMITNLPKLTGRDLACWCAVPEPGQPDHCHGAVLLELANKPRLGIEIPDE